MPASKEFARLGGLFNAASNQSKPFLTKCSKTKFLAVSNYYQASDQYVELAKEVLNARNLGLRIHTTCLDCLSDIKGALESGQLDSGYLDALEELRTRYLEEILKPAFKEYFNERVDSNSDLESIYLNALKIDGLVETIQFMNKVQPTD